MGWNSVANSIKATRTVDFNLRFCGSLFQFFYFTFFNFPFADTNPYIIGFLRCPVASTMPAAVKTWQMAEKKFKFRREVASFFSLSFSL